MVIRQEVAAFPVVPCLAPLFASPPEYRPSLKIKKNFNATALALTALLLPVAALAQINTCVARGLSSIFELK